MTLFEMEPVCATCKGSKRIWHAASGEHRACPSCARRDAPIRARSTDPDTSHKASAEITAREGTTATIRPGSQKHKILMVYAVVYPRAITDTHAWQGANLSARSGAWHRCSDLLQAGYIEQVGTTIDHETNKEVRTCRITTSGLEILRANNEEVTL